MSKRFSVILPETDSKLLEDISVALQEQTVDISLGEVLIIHSPRNKPINLSEGFQCIPVDKDNQYASDKRNLGMRLARGEVLLFLDDDCIPDRDWIERHLNCHTWGQDVVGGSVRFENDNYIQAADNLSAFHFMVDYTSPGYRPYLCTANMSVKRAVVDRCGPMERHRNRAEDLEWTTRIRCHGYELYFDPRARVLHKPNRGDLSSFWSHWWNDAPSTLDVRLRYADQLGTPKLANRRSMYLWGSPLVAAWATIRTFSHPKSWLRFWHTVPLVYLTKLIWCWSAYRNYQNFL